MQTRPSVRTQSEDRRDEIPSWYHKHGDKVLFDRLTPSTRSLVLCGTAARVTIMQASLIHQRATGWFVDWEVIQCKPFDEGARGRVKFNDEDLASAFGLSNQSGKFGNWLLERFGGDVAEQGKYIRQGRFLNIPCPGTGHDGDPNVSIFVDERMQDAIRQLLQR